jgi:hypothetical protein
MTDLLQLAILYIVGTAMLYAVYAIPVLIGIAIWQAWKGFVAVCNVVWP